MNAQFWAEARRIAKTNAGIILDEKRHEFA
jgi:hypothetical protein